MKEIKNITKLSKRQGVALAENILLISISLVIIVSIFYPTFKSIISDSITSVSNWFSSALASISIG